MLGVCEVFVVCHPNSDPDASILIGQMIRHMVITCPMRGCRHIVPRSLGNQLINLAAPKQRCRLASKTCIKPHGCPIARADAVCVMVHTSSSTNTCNWTAS